MIFARAATVATLAALTLAGCSGLRAPAPPGPDDVPPPLSQEAVSETGGELRRWAESVGNDYRTCRQLYHSISPYQSGWGWMAMERAGFLLREVGCCVPSGRAYEVACDPDSEGLPPEVFGGSFPPEETGTGRQ